MNGEEVSGPPGPKLLRLFYFVAAGVVCTAAINKYRQYEQHQQQQQQQSEPETSSDAAAAVTKPLK